MAMEEVVGVAQTGRILQFDDARGYGFIAPYDGGEDVFLHVNDFDADEALLTAGRRVEFEVLEGGRGKKAYAVRIAEEQNVTPADVAPREAALPAEKAAAPAGGARPVPEADDGLCDVLPAAELRVELSELFLTGVPELTGGQVLRLREDILLLAQKHGWTEE